MNLWHWLGSDFGGNIAQWVGGIGATAAFFFAIYVLRRDSKYQRVRQAKRVLAFRGEVDREGHEYRVTVTNTSDQPVFEPVLIVSTPEKRAAERPHDVVTGVLRMPDHLMPGQSESASIKTGYWSEFQLDWYLAFRDADGAYRIKSLGKSWLKGFDRYVRELDRHLAQAANLGPLPKSEGTSGNDRSRAGGR